MHASSRIRCTIKWSNHLPEQQPNHTHTHEIFGIGFSLCINDLFGRKLNRLKSFDFVQRNVCVLKCANGAKMLGIRRDWISPNAISFIDRARELRILIESIPNDVDDDDNVDCVGNVVCFTLVPITSD